MAPHEMSVCSMAQRTTSVGPREHEREGGRMAENLTRKIIRAHLADGDMKPGNEISLRLDQGLLQDTTGTMGFLQLEELGIDQIKIPFAIVYVDHNILAIDFKNH